MSDEGEGCQLEEGGSSESPSLPGNVAEILDYLNRQASNRSWWRKVKDWWLYPKGHRQIAMNDRDLPLEQYLLLRIHQVQIDNAARSHELSMVTWVLVVIAVTTLIAVIAT